MKYDQLILEADGKLNPDVPRAVSRELIAIQNAINVELSKLKNDSLIIEVRLDWHHDITRGLWLPLLGFTWSAKNNPSDQASGKMQLDIRGTEELLSNQSNVIASRIRVSALAIAGLTKSFDNDLRLDDPEATINDNGEYGDGFFFNDVDLDHPDINIATKPFNERMHEIKAYLQKTVSESVRAELYWDWHCTRKCYYPRVSLKYGGSEFNVLAFDLDYSYRILKGKDLEIIQGLLANALKSIEAIKS